jgi:hypothetical protein
MIITSRQAIDVLQEAGTISAGDADELRTFAAFLDDVAPVGPPGAPGRAERIRAAYAEHYPDDHAAAVAAATTFVEPEPEPAPVVDDTVARLTQHEFDALLDYSASLPTGTTIGKQWKRRNDYHDKSKGWRLGEYVEHDNPDLVGIRWRDIEIIPPSTTGGAR